MLYDYVCTCGEERQVEHPMKEDPKIVCDKCKKIMERKLNLDVAAVHFKGDGFTKRVR